MRALHEIIRRPVITEKGLTAKETSSKKSAGTLVFVVANDATKTEIKEAVQKAFNVRSMMCALRTSSAKNAVAASSPDTSRIGRRRMCA